MIINDLDGYYIVFDTKNWNTELDTLTNNQYGHRDRHGNIREVLDANGAVCQYTDYFFE